MKYLCVLFINFYEVIIIMIMVRGIVPLKLCGKYFQIFASTRTFDYVGKSELYLLNSSLSFVVAHVVLIPWASAGSTKCRECVV